METENVIEKEKENATEEEKKNLVKYDNDFILSSNFNQLSVVQQDVFFSAVSYLCRNKATHVIIPSSSIKMRANLTGKNYTQIRYYKLLHGLEDIVLKTIFTVHSGGKEWKGSLFDTFAIDESTGDFEMFLNPHAANFFFQIPGPYSQFELQVFMGLNSKYAKNLFRVLIAKYHGRWNPDMEELIAVFGLKSKSSSAALIHRMPKYIEEIQKTGYFDFIDFSIIRDTTKQGRPIKQLNFQFKESDQKRNEIKTLSRWWGEQKLSSDEKSYIPRSESEAVPEASSDLVAENIVTESVKEKDCDDFKCPICGAKYKKSHNPKLQKDFWGHLDYAHSKCRYAKKTFDTLEELKDFIQLEQEKKAQKEKFKKQRENDPIAKMAAQAAIESSENEANIVFPPLIERLLNKDKLDSGKF